MGTYICRHRGNIRLGHSKKAVIFKTGKEASEGISPDNILILDF